MNWKPGDRSSAAPPPEPRIGQPRGQDRRLHCGRAPEPARSARCRPASRTPASSASCAAASPARSSRCAPTWTRCRWPRRSTCRSRRRCARTYNGQDVGVMHACGHDVHMAMLHGRRRGARRHARAACRAPSVHLPARRGRRARRASRAAQAMVAAKACSRTRSPTRSSACTSAHAGRGGHDHVPRERRHGRAPTSSDDRRARPADARRDAVGRASIPIVVASHDRRWGCRRSSSRQTKLTVGPGGRHRRRDRGRRAQQHHPRQRGDDRHDPHVRSRDARRPPRSA